MASPVLFSLALLILVSQAIHLLLPITTPWKNNGCFQVPDLYWATVNLVKGLYSKLCANECPVYNETLIDDERGYIVVKG